MTTGLDYIKRKYGKDSFDFKYYLNFREEVRAYNQGIIDAIDALAGKLDDMFADEQIIEYIKYYFIDRDELEKENKDE